MINSVEQIIAPLIAAAVALYVGENWRKTLRNKRLDECLAAVHEVMGLVNRCLSLKEDNAPREQVWLAYSEAWNSWRKFDQATAIVYRYDKTFDRNTPDRIATLLFDVKKLCNEEWKEGGAIKSQIQQERDRIKRELKQIATDVELATQKTTMLENFFKSNSPLLRNERVKMAAAFWNTVGAGIFIGSLAGAFFLPKPPFWDKVGIAAMGFVLGLACHWIGSSILKKYWID